MGRPRELLEENAVAFTLTDSDRVILMHQGYKYYVLRGTADDPEVWSYSEGRAKWSPPQLPHVA